MFQKYVKNVAFFILKVSSFQFTETVWSYGILLYSITENNMINQAKLTFLSGALMNKQLKTVTGKHEC